MYFTLNKRNQYVADQSMLILCTKFNEIAFHSFGKYCEDKNFGQTKN